MRKLKAMTASSCGISFYLFDFDDNIMVLGTQVFVLNTVTKTERALSTGEFATIQPSLGRPGKWEEYTVFDGSFRNFRDTPPHLLGGGHEQYFVNDIKKAIGSDPRCWQGPSWPYFVHACKAQRPLSIVTARGHTRETLQEGVRVLAANGLIPDEPNYHAIFPAGNDAVRRELGDADLTMTVPALKRRAILAAVEQAVEQFGSEPDLHFGMSDDDPANVDLIIRAMSECKKKYLERRFFVINTHMHQEVKLEVFPMDMPVTRVL